jgi:hypothetical protein
MGAVDLKANSQRFLRNGLIVSAAIHLSLIGFYIGSKFMKTEDEAAYTGRVIRMETLPPPPPLSSAPPPQVLGVSDSKVLTEMADAVLFVVRWGETTIDAVEDALKELAAARATLGGAVVVQVDVDRHAQYGFGGIDSYMSRYSDYYVN